MEAFAADSSPGAFAKVVDRLLASPHYGERWARHWLDLARYADGEPVTVNYGVGRNGFVNVWRYRDWVIQALNDDVPFSEEPGLFDPENGCGFNWSDTVVTGVKSGYRMSRVPYSKEWCWIRL